MTKKPTLDEAIERLITDNMKPKNEDWAIKTDLKTEINSRLWYSLCDIEPTDKRMKLAVTSIENMFRTYKQELRKKISFAAQELWDKGICIAKQETERIIRHALLEEDK